MCIAFVVCFVEPVRKVLDVVSRMYPSRLKLGLDKVGLSSHTEQINSTKICTISIYIYEIQTRIYTNTIHNYIPSLFTPQQSLYKLNFQLES